MSLPQGHPAEPESRLGHLAAESMLLRPLEPLSLVWKSSKRQGVWEPRPLSLSLFTTPGGAEAKRSTHFVEERLCACLAFAMFSFPPEAIKQQFLDSSLLRDLLPPLERTLLFPASSPPHVLNGGLSTLIEQTCPQGSGPWRGHSVWPLPSRQAGPHPSPSLPCQPQLLTSPLAPRRPSPRCPHTAGG